MKKLACLILLLLFLSNTLFAQVGINTDNSAPDPSAGLDVKFPDKGILPPRMTIDQRNAIANPADGLMVFCTDCGANGSFSVFSNGAWKTFVHCIPPPASTAASNTVSPGQVTWKWTTVAGASGYKWNTVNNYSSATDMATATAKTETGISCGATYTRYVWAYNVCGFSVPAALSQAVSAFAPATPSPGTHVATKTSITWNWSPDPDIVGYKWNTVNDIATATDIGTATTENETGLTCGSSYTHYVWAYNGCGISTPVALTQSTLACTCGPTISLLIHHTAGNVAPVSKTVLYGTVTNIPGETTKCWITSNLGATRQAYAVQDSPEDPAGWYWQFNGKQGYKYDGTRTPNSLWITNINENSEWTTTNDPCALELGSGWRIPTLTEWGNVDGQGNWHDWNGPWNSGLKLHAAGFLRETDGSLDSRGQYGCYWSSTPAGVYQGFSLRFFSTDSSISTQNRAFGYSVRCVRDF